jgi:hypothetical protein
MQLPRGTFREIRKTVVIESLLHELEGEKFSGIANISSQSLTGTLVFKAGKCILVKFQNSRGDGAWDELQKARSEDVDAALALLGDAQIELALEFNKQFRIQLPGTHAPVRAPHRAPAPSASREPLHPVQAQKPAMPVAPQKSPVKPAPVRHHIPVPPAAPQAPAQSLPPRLPPFSKAVTPIPPSPPIHVPRHEGGENRDAGQPAEKDHNDSSFENDLDTFDTMDFDTVTDKIRTDCKTMIKQLHLDHLMER